MKFFTALAFAAMTLASTRAFAAALLFQCPERIAVQETTRGPYPPWEVTADKGEVDVHLQAMLLFDGHPREMASLVPGKTTAAGSRLTAVWHLAPPEADRAYWVACTYRNSKTMLTQRLPNTVSRCSYTQTRSPSGAPAGIESFICE